MDSSRKHLKRRTRASRTRSTAPRRRPKRLQCRIPRTRWLGSTPIHRRSLHSGSERESSRPSTCTSVLPAGARTMSEITYLEAIREGLFEEMELDKNVFCLGEDIGAYGGAFKVTEGLMAKYGEPRVIDTPISEAAIIGAAAGAAHLGKRPRCARQLIAFLSRGNTILPTHSRRGAHPAGL